MILSLIRYLLLGMAVFPLIYYGLSIISSWRFFRRRSSPVNAQPPGGFTPPVSILIPIRGLDPDSYENFASFCRQDYPEYELLFCVDDRTSPVLTAIDALRRDFPERRIRVLYGSGRNAANDKAAKLARLSSEAQYEVLVINDSDVRVRPDYLRTIVAPLGRPGVGAVTCLYVPINPRGLVDHLQTVGMLSDFYAGVLVARDMDGVKFALGPAIASTRSHLARFGGYDAIANRPADDLLIGRLVAEQGLEVVLLPYSVETVADYRSFNQLFHKRMRWIIEMRHLRPWGHLGMIFTQGLPWVLVAAALCPPVAAVWSYFGAYFGLRLLMTVMIGIVGLKQHGLWKQLPLIPLWDVLASFIWLLSFVRDSFRWRDVDYRIRNGELVPVHQEGAPVHDVSPTK